MANRMLLVPTSRIKAEPMSDEEIARCQRIILEQTALYDTTKDALVVVADLDRNKAIPVYQHLLDDPAIRDRLPRYRADIPLAEAIRTMDYETRVLFDIVDEALDIYLGADAD